MHMHVLVLWITNESATAKIISLRQIYYISGQIMEQTTFLLYLELLWFSSSSKSSSEEKLGECALLFSSRRGEKYPESILSCWIEIKCFFNLYFSVFCKRVHLFHRSIHEEIYAVITWVKHVLFLCFIFFSIQIMGTLAYFLHIQSTGLPPISLENSLVTSIEFNRSIDFWIAVPEIEHTLYR